MTTLARLASVAGDALITYFENRYGSLNELYLVLKAGLRETSMSGFPVDAHVESRVQHAWKRYLEPICHCSMIIQNGRFRVLLPR